MKRNHEEKSSLRARGQSFRYATDGLLAFFKNQPNAVIHLLFTILAGIAAVIWNVSGLEAIALVLATGFVWAAELFNTAIEAIMDHLSPEKHPAVKYIKDVAAAAVLVAALTALVVGLVIFIPKFL